MVGRTSCRSRFQMYAAENDSITRTRGDGRPHDKQRAPKKGLFNESHAFAAFVSIRIVKVLL